jgi:polysaccharide biosynthesis/export protein
MDFLLHSGKRGRWMKSGIRFLIAWLLVLGCFSISFGAEGSFKIGPGDVLEISVWRDDSLTRDIIVPPDGIIAFPLIGDVPVKRLTVTQLRERITERLADFIPDATVTVILKQINSLRAYVIGKVRKPGQFAIAMDTTVMQLLSMAEGLNPYANESSIYILRQEGGVTVKIPFDYKRMVKGEKLKQNILLNSGDVIVVP